MKSFRWSSCNKPQELSYLWQRGKSWSIWTLLIINRHPSNFWNSTSSCKDAVLRDSTWTQKNYLNSALDKVESNNEIEGTIRLKCRCIFLGLKETGKIQVLKHPRVKSIILMATFILRACERLFPWEVLKLQNNTIIKNLPFLGAPRWLHQLRVCLWVRS